MNRDTPRQTSSIAGRNSSSGYRAGIIWRAIRYADL